MVVDWQLIFRDKDNFVYFYQTWHKICYVRGRSVNFLKNPDLLSILILHFSVFQWLIVHCGT